ncbi:MAG: hypothetical protein H6510_08095 [Acidobacteria bacterium]|nr:hypothetical protein [Acidobacteriota bacterium]
MLTELCQSLCQDFGFDACFAFQKSGKILARFPDGSEDLGPVSHLVARNPSEVRFFRWDKLGSGHMCLLPLSTPIDQAECLVFAYPQAHWLQDLLKNRILPMHLNFWVSEQAAELRVSDREEDVHQLVRALAEKRAYARQLEAKVEDLSEMIVRIKQSEISLDQKVEKLEDIIRDQTKMFRQMAESYQTQFDEWEKSEREHIRMTVHMESRIAHLNAEVRRLQLTIANQNHKLRVKMAPQDIIQLKIEALRNKK